MKAIFHSGVIFSFVTVKPSLVDSQFANGELIVHTLSFIRIIRTLLSFVSECLVFYLQISFMNEKNRQNVRGVFSCRVSKTWYSKQKLVSYPWMKRDMLVHVKANTDSVEPNATACFFSSLFTNE